MQCKRHPLYAPDNGGNDVERKARRYQRLEIVVGTPGCWARTTGSWNVLAHAVVALAFVRPSQPQQDTTFFVTVLIKAAKRYARNCPKFREIHVVIIVRVPAQRWIVYVSNKAAAFTLVDCIHIGTVCNFPTFALQPPKIVESTRKR